MACYPPGMDLKRIIVTAYRDETNPIVIQ